MTSKAERRRRKKAHGDPFAIPDIPKRQPNGQYRNRLSDDPAIETLKARCRQMGKEITKATLRDMRAPWWGCNAGRAMAGLADSDAERAEMWDAICHMRRVVTAYDAAIGAPKRHATCLRLLAPIAALEADASTPPSDERTPREKQDDACAAIMRLEGWIGMADRLAITEAKRVVWDDAMVGDAQGLIAALRCVADGLFGRPVVYRGRAHD